jgi:hypothetical protein
VQWNTWFLACIILDYILPTDWNLCSNQISFNFKIP